jgi:membrane-associated protein
MAVLGPLAVLLLMAVLFAETGLLAGFFLPGDSLLFTAGVLVASGAIHLPVWLVAVGAFAAAVVGDQVGYLVGRRFGPRVFSRRDSRWLSPDHVARAQAFFDRHGPKAVVLARFVPLVRTLTPAVAGMGGMPRRRFTAYNVAGGLVWAVGMLLAGFFLGGVPFVAAHIELLAVAVVVVSLVPATLTMVRRTVLSRRGQAASAPATAEPRSSASTVRAVTSGRRRVRDSATTTPYMSGRTAAYEATATVAPTARPATTSRGKCAPT